ncbi:Glucosamine-6-phosphate isomerase (Glucosamine-6-phosphate deaminase) (GNPDA) (GlcN6P deaminase) [Coemansia erecta]|uniref:Beta-hexosaminidase n=1 Tax=Coemansia erecta TaxID=147472 RepID=A0A9W7Y6J1_9FUNG|nr:Glucosamine-6-phosphate isomerase (Glucosamine-6-phosphate deaminase) (GNPDA) (GlcN6P deaminase) [Coemansia erecta]
MFFLNILLLATVPASLALWPIPHTVKTGQSNSGAQCIDISAKGDVGDIAKSAIDRYTALVNRHNFTAPLDYKKGITETDGVVSSLEVSVDDQLDTLDLDTDESYTLDIPVDGISTLKAKTPYGIIHGLETFSQLVFANGDNKAIFNTPVHIEDSPAFPHRGILLDTARNYFSVVSIKRVLDAMSYNKLNVLHWHIVDAQSWPVESKVYPELQEKGAYSPDMQYSYDDVDCIVKYAKERAIRVIPEFDVPGHTFIVGKAFPELVSCMNKQPYWDKYAAEPPSGQLNIAKPETIEFAEKIFAEYTKLFPDAVFHLGGDEVNRDCWNEDSDVQQYLKDNPDQDIESLLVDWYSKIHEYLASTGKTALTWEETLFHSNYTPPKDTIIQTWIDEQSIPKTVAKGYRSIASPSSSYYLDCGHGSWLSNNDGNSWCDPFKTWMHVYNFDPLANITDASEQKLVIGAEVAIWAEQTDETVIDQRLWPRAAAMAETAWSGKADASGHVRTTSEVASRLHEQRFRMVDRGIGAEPMQPLWCVRNPGSCALYSDS